MPDDPAPRKPSFQERLEHRRDAYREKGPVYRAAWIVAGAVVVLAGVAMIALPGPAVVVIPIGLAMLSFEFAWAQRLLDRGIEGGGQLREVVRHADGRVKVLGALALVCLVLAVAVVAYAVLR